jgi:tetratricopeptide (TPR) repeat protein
MNLFPVWSWLLLGLPSLATAKAPPAVTFNEQIAPIIYQNCSTCHRPGETGPFSLLSYSDVKKHAEQIADVTKRRYMPPWLPEAGYGDFAEERRLSDEQIAIIQEWVKQGELEGPTANAPQPPRFNSEWQLGPPDMVVKVAKPYQLYADGPEVFWNFVIPVPLKTPRWVKAIEVRPGASRVFHHANAIIDRSGSALRQEKTPGAGFPGMDLTIEDEDRFDPDSHFLSWKPGSLPVVEPDGMAWRADPGMNLVLNVHLRPSGKVETVSPSIGLYFTDEPQTKFPMLVQLEHDSAINIPAGDKDFVVTDEFRCPLDLKVLAIYPHAHYLGKLLQGYATLPDGTKKWLVRIPDWDLNWQGVYRLKTPLELPKDTVIKMEYHYDNSATNVRNPNNPPQRVIEGNQATNEMGHLWLQVLPDDPADHRPELQEALSRHRLEKYPGDFSANYILGDLMLNRDKAEDAIPYFEKASLALPDSALAASELGVALVQAQKIPEAVEQFKRALALDPNYADARYNLASVEAQNGDWEAAAKDYKEVIAERADNVKASQHLGEVLFLWGDDLKKAGKTEEAVTRYREALVYRADDPELHTSLGIALAELARNSEARAEFQSALRIDPNFQEAKQALTTLQSKK